MTSPHLFLNLLYTDNADAKTWLPFFRFANYNYETFTDNERGIVKIISSHYESIKR